MRTRIKFCGLTRIQDVQKAVALGVDADIDMAIKLIRQVPPFVIKVGLFMNAKAEDVEHITNNVNLNLLQFHGDEEEKFCAQFDMQYLKAVPMASIESVEEFCAGYGSATGYVLDSHAKGEMGGSGEQFVWSNIPKNLGKPLILAGGLTKDNVAQAIQTVAPYAVDVSSGIETSKGIKDPVRMEKFIKEVHRD